MVAEMVEMEWKMCDSSPAKELQVLYSLDVDIGRH